MKRLNKAFYEEWEKTLLAVAGVFLLAIIALWAATLGKSQEEVEGYKNMPEHASLLNSDTAFRFHRKDASSDTFGEKQDPFYKQLTNLTSKPSDDDKKDKNDKKPKDDDTKNHTFVNISFPETDNGDDDKGKDKDKTGNKKPPVKTKNDKSREDKPEKDTQPVPQIPRLKYLGMMSVGSGAPQALVVIKRGDQRASRFVSKGGNIGKYEVAECTGKHLQIVSPGGEKRSIRFKETQEVKLK